MNANRKSVRGRCATIAENQEPPFWKKQNNQPPLWRVVADRELLQSYCLLLFDHGTADYDAAGGVVPTYLSSFPPAPITKWRRWSPVKVMVPVPFTFTV